MAIDLRNKTPQEKANLKGFELAKVGAIARHKRGDFEIEILETSPIEGGVQVLARAWKDGKQCGFGKDGSVEIERIRFFNPPILVPSAEGDITRSKTDPITSVPKETKYREDPREALLQSVEQAVSLIAKEGKSIRKGKIGNTTSVFRPSPSTGTPPIDAGLRRINAGETFSSIRTSAGTEARNTETDDAVGTIVANGGGASNWTQMARSVWGFPTGAGIPATDVISSATLGLRGTSANNQFSQSVVIDRMVPASASAAVTSDYDIANWDGVEQAIARITIASWNTSGFNTFTLNSTGIANIAKGSGYSWYGGRLSADFDNSSPTPSNTFARAECYFADQTGTTNDPTLTVEHEAPPAVSGVFRRRILTMK